MRWAALLMQRRIAQKVRLAGLVLVSLPKRLNPTKVKTFFKTRLQARKSHVIVIDCVEEKASYKKRSEINADEIKVSNKSQIYLTRLQKPVYNSRFS